jgi:hypothetical protein
MSKQDISTEPERAASRVFISYSHDSTEHQQRVLALAERLRKDGVDAQLDQYVAGTPRKGWPRWMEDQLDWAQFVLVICTGTYQRRFLGREEPGKGKGADWEGSLITLELYHARSDTSKFVPVLFDPEDNRFIPGQLSGHTHYLLNSEDNYAKLYDFLTGQAGVVPGELGKLKARARVAVEPLTFGEPGEDTTAGGKIKSEATQPKEPKNSLKDFSSQSAPPIVAPPVGQKPEPPPKQAPPAHRNVLPVIGGILAVVIVASVILFLWHFNAGKSQFTVPRLFAAGKTQQQFLVQNLSELSSELSSAGLIVAIPKIHPDDSRPPKTNEIRYYHPEDQALAMLVACCAESQRCVGCGTTSRNGRQ